MSDTKVLTPDGTQHLIDKIKSEKESTFRYTTMPIASAENLGQVVQYLGATTSVAPIYTNGFFYKCVAQGTDPETYAWEQTNVQPTSGGDERVKPEITEMGVRIDDGFRPYIKVNANTIIPQFSTASLEDIALVTDLYYNGDISLADIQEVWSVGDSKDIVVGATETTAEQTVALKIVDFNHDTLVNVIGESEKALLTLGFELAENGTMGGDSSSGWSGCSLRTWCNSSVKQVLPSSLKSNIKLISRTVPNGGLNSPSNTTVQDNVFIPTINEFIGRTVTKAETGHGSDSFFYWYPGNAGTRYAGHTISDFRSKQMLTASSAYNSSSGVPKPVWWQLAQANNSGSASTGNPTSGIMPHFCI